MQITHREILVWLGLGLLLRLALGVFATHGVLVDDAYITLRYAVNAAETGELVYNAGEPVFGVTSPLWAFVTAGLAWIFGRGGVEAAVFGAGVLFWMLAVRRAVWITGAVSGIAAARVVAAVLLFAPVFVDNQLLGMETPLVVWLFVEALGAAREGRIERATGWAGLLMVARPEGVLFVPALLFLGASQEGVRALALRLARPANAARLVGPGLLWTAFALQRYGTVLPQSMVAKSGWNSAHYETLATLENAWLGLSRLTFVPFVDYLPTWLAHLVTASVAAVVLAVLVLQVRRGTPHSRAAFASYALFLVFYLAGKGATEASWYAVPPSVLLLLAAAPAIGPHVSPRSRVVPVALAATLALLAVVLGARRAPLLASYAEGYGRCADALEAMGPAAPAESVLVGEIGVFGFRTTRRVIDVGALVSPEVLPIKNRGVSLVRMARELNADWLVISDVALETNRYPSVGQVWANDGERAWLDGAHEVAHEADKRLLRLPHRGHTDVSALRLDD